MKIPLYKRDLPDIDLEMEQKRKRRMIAITFGVLGFVLFNLIMYLLAFGV